MLAHLAHSKCARWTRAGARWKMRRQEGTHAKGNTKTANLALNGFHCAAPPRGERGFTLIEMVLTIALLGIVLALVLPRIGLSSSVSASSRQLAGTVRALFIAAASSNHFYRLNVDLDRQVYWATMLTADGDRLPSDPALAFRTALPSTVGLDDITTGRHGRVTAGKVFIQFFPGGRVEPAVIHLSNHEDQFVTLVVNPLTGGVHATDRYLEPTALPVPETYLAFFKALPPRPPTSREEAGEP